jgi:hypothetical protein
MFEEGFTDAGREEQFSYPALIALYGYYTNLEEEIDEDIIYDVVAICLDWSEYDSVTEAAHVMGRETDDPEEAKNFLESKTDVIYLIDSVLVGNW